MDWSLGKIYEVQYKNRVMTEIMTLLISPTEKGHKKSICDLLAVNTITYTTNIELYHESILSIKEITVKDFPLYMNWSYKSETFLNLITGVEYYGSKKGWSKNGF